VTRTHRYEHHKNLTISGTCPLFSQGFWNFFAPRCPLDWSKLGNSRVRVFLIESRRFEFTIKLNLNHFSTLIQRPISTGTSSLHPYLYNTTSVPYDLGARPLALRTTLRDSSVDLYGDPVICHLGPCSLRLVDIHPGAVRLHCHIQAWVNCWRWLIAGPFFNFVGKFPKTLYVSRESWEGWEKKGVIVIFLLLVWMEGIWK
jgi:hypothetical protein